MATMLSVLATDARVPAGALQQALRRAVNASFNCITIDGDTSTNDTVLCFARERRRADAYAGNAGVPDLSGGPRAGLPHAGQDDCPGREGATKLAEIRVEGAGQPPRRAGRPRPWPIRPW